MAKKEARKAREADERRLSGAPIAAQEAAPAPAAARPGKVKAKKVTPAAAAPAADSGQT